MDPTAAAAAAAAAAGTARSGQGLRSDPWAELSLSKRTRGPGVVRTRSAVSFFKYFSKLHFSFQHVCQSCNKESCQGQEGSTKEVHHWLLQGRRRWNLRCCCFCKYYLIFLVVSVFCQGYLPCPKRAFVQGYLPSSKQERVIFPLFESWNRVPFPMDVWNRVLRFADIGFSNWLNNLILENNIGKFRCRWRIFLYKILEHILFMSFLKAQGFFPCVIPIDSLSFHVLLAKCPFKKKIRKNSSTTRSRSTARLVP